MEWEWVCGEEGRAYVMGMDGWVRMGVCEWESVNVSVCCDGDGRAKDAREWGWV